MNKTNKILLVIAIIANLVALALLARYVVFADQFTQWGEGLEKVDAWQKAYMQEHPNATKEEMDAAFKEGIEKINSWKAEYRAAHPDATEAEIDAAFNALWEGR